MIDKKKVDVVGVVKKSIIDTNNDLKRYMNKQVGILKKNYELMIFFALLKNYGEDNLKVLREEMNSNDEFDEFIEMVKNSFEHKKL